MQAHGCERCDADLQQCRFAIASELAVKRLGLDPTYYGKIKVTSHVGFFPVPDSTLG
jgi:hypothetical protein